MLAFVRDPEAFKEKVDKKLGLSNIFGKKFEIATISQDGGRWDRRDSIGDRYCDFDPGKYPPYIIVIPSDYSGNLYDAKGFEIHSCYERWSHSKLEEKPSGKKYLGEPGKLNLEI